MINEKALSLPDDFIKTAKLNPDSINIINLYNACMICNNAFNELIKETAK